jgi:hypothetical protein
MRLFVRSDFVHAWEDLPPWLQLRDLHEPDLSELFSCLWGSMRLETWSPLSRFGIPFRGALKVFGSRSWGSRSPQVQNHRHHARHPRLGELLSELDKIVRRKSLVPLFVIHQNRKIYSSKRSPKNRFRSELDKIVLCETVLFSVPILE